MTTIREAIRRAHAYVKLTKEGNNWVINNIDPSRKVWHEVRVQDFYAGQATRREMMIRVALEQLGVPGPHYRAHYAAQDAGDWRKILRREYQKVRQDALEVRT